MNETSFYTVIAETSAAYINNIINFDLANKISEFVGNDIVITIVTTVIGIIAGAACSITNQFWRNFTIILSAALFNLFMLLRMVFVSEPWYYLVFSLVVWLILCTISIVFLREKNVVSRAKIGKMIEKFTSTANPNKDVCIFAGDIDFFGDVIERMESSKEAKTSTTKISLYTLCDRIKEIRKKRFLDRVNIENNSQLNQLRTYKFRSVCILCVKPQVKEDDINDDYHKDRIRIGYIKNALGDRVHFKFFNDDCDNCFFYEQNDCMLQKCDKQCSLGSEQSCTCPKINNAYSHPSLPDTTLRGRIVTNRETGAKCVAITTKKSSRKEYILRQYGSGEKESSLYNVIWKVWWKMCDMDNDFVESCLDEYKISMKKENR